jgi:hypothetical protein
MSRRFLKQAALSVLFFLCSGMLIFSLSTIDLSEKILKIKNQRPNDFGDKGFGVYDWGEKKYKIFDWTFKIVESFPITIGEGPGEIKPYVFNAFIYNDKVYVNGHLSRGINVYSKKGKFLNSISIDFTPRSILFHGNKIYIFNSTVISPTKSPFVQILNADTGKQVNAIHLKSKIPKPKDMDDDVSMYFIHYDIGSDNLIYMLHAMDNSILIIDEDGNIIKKIKLPHEPRIKQTITKDGANVNVGLDTLDFYSDIKCSKDGVYLTFFKTDKIIENSKDGSIELVIKTYLVKWGKNGKFTEKIFDGDFIFLGAQNDTIYLFNREEYYVFPVKLLGGN